MSLREIIEAINGEGNINLESLVKGIKTDTRKINKGDIFIALKGKNYNGHDYIEEAIKKGAICCIVDEAIDNSKCIKVDDTYKSLYDIAKYIRNKYNIPLIAITGSNGKTTTKDLIFHILSSKYLVLGNEESKNNLIGVSDTLFKLDNSYDYIVLELGSNHMGEISYLSKMCNPDIALITNIGSSHLGYFKTRKNIFKEKSSILDGMNNKNIIVNGDDKYLKKLSAYKCGISKKNNLVAYNIYEDFNRISFNIRLDKEYNIVFNNPGRHFINDILLAIKVCLDCGISMKKIIKRINDFKMTNKRMNVIKLKNNTLINDCYNSSYESLIAGISCLKNIKDNKVIILGDILELGKYSKRIHKKINRKIKKVRNIEILTVGKYSKYIKGKNFIDVDSLLEYINYNPINNSYIYVKGSRRMNLDKLVDYLKENYI